MAEQIISPGVFTRENDISFIQPAPVDASSAFIGPTVKGPVENPTVVTSYNQYKAIFGETFTANSTTKEFLTSLAVKNFFQQGGNSALITRVVSSSANWTSATSTAVSCELESGTLALADLGAGSGGTYSGVDDTYTNIPLSGSLAGDNTGAVATVVVSGDAVTSITVTAGGSGFVDGENVTFPASLLGGTGTHTVAIDNADIVNTAPFTLKTHGQGIIYNNATSATDAGSEIAGSGGALVSGSADNIRWEVTNVDNAQGSFSLLIRRGNDNNSNKVILETFNNVTLDPNSDRYIEKVIGNQYTTVVTDGTAKFVRTVGSELNKSNYVYVSAVGAPTLNYLAADGLTVNSDTSGNSYSASLPTVGSGSFYNAVGNTVVSGMTFGDSLSNTNTQGLQASDYSTAITILENKDEYVINSLAAPGLVYEYATHATVIDSLISTAETRSDCIAVVDMLAYNSGNGTAAAVTEAKKLNSSYAATYWPWVQMSGGAGLQWAPASCVVPGVYAFTDSSSAPWFAPAGLVRGGITGVVQAEQKLSRSQRDTLYAGKVNPIATFPGQGIAVFGQKTLQTKSSALDRVNVRRLLIALKKFLGDQASNLVFEQNTIATRNRFLANVNPYLESVVQRQGLYTYRVVMDDTNNTADVVDRNQLVGQIFIQPAKTAEFIVLDFTIEPTGATFA